MSTWEGKSSVGIGAAQITVCSDSLEVTASAVAINAPVAEQWGTGLVAPFITYANLIGAKWNLNPRLILGMISMETNFCLESEPTCQGENVISAPSTSQVTGCDANGVLGTYSNALDAINQGVKFLTQCEFPTAKHILAAIGDYNKVCPGCTSQDISPYGASVAYLANFNSCADSTIPNGFVGYLPSTLNGASDITVMRGCGSDSTRICSYA